MHKLVYLLIKKYVFTIINTHIIVYILNHMVDIHEKGIITHIKVCIHKYKYSYICMYTKMYLYEY